MATVHGAMREALRHPRYPLSELSRRLQALRNSRDGLFDVLLSFERQDYSIAFGAARLVDSRQLFAGLARYPLSVTICEFHAEQDLELVLEGSTACFGAGEVELLGQRFRHLLSVLTECPERTVDRVDVLPPAERWALVDGLHRRVASHEDPQPFIRLFERQAALRADAVALVWDGGRWTYGALDRRADRLARRLLTMAVRRGSVVAMALERAPEMVVALLAIAKCGAAFLPLDPETPPARLREILADSEAVALLIQQRNRDRLATLHGSVESIDDAADDLGACDPMPPVALLADDLAYVLFTSGSSGRPKGVVIDHGTLARRLAWLSRTYAVCWSDRSGQATQYTFDPALIELCLPLINGASIALPPAGQLAPAALADFAIGQAVTIMAFVPATLERFVDAVAGRPGLCLRVACCGGEVLAPELANRFLRETGARLYNVYGPTETAIFATAWPCQAQAEATPLPIGWAIDDTRIHVLDERGQPLPFGEAGEIHIGGRAIGRGYLNRPDLTAAAFIADPFHPGGRLYRTGDLGWLDCDGKLHFRGRRDRQIKLRGYRIELGEIEAALLAIDGVRRAAACLWHGEGRPAIQAWVAGDGTQDGTALRQALRQRLPDYMLPTSVACLAHLPETTSGKIDYDALPAPRHPLADGHRRVADGDLEIRLTTLWQSALGKRQLSVQDNFFDLGGDSLAAVDILAGVERLLGRKAPLYLLTENPTIERLARALAETTATTPPILRLGKPVGAPALYLAASGHGDLLRFQSLAQALDGRFDLHMLQPPDAASVASIGDLADLYAERIVARGDSPGYLAGFSVGGIAALETARRLRERGLAVNGLVLIDTVYPSALVRAWRLWQGFGWLTRLLHVQELSMNGRRLGAMFSDPGLVAQVMALGGYCPAPYEGTTLLIKSSGLANWQRWLFRPWRGLLARGQIAEAESPGLHGSLFDPGNVGALAARLAAMLPGQDGHARHDA
jgi:amino acid adenylation domain-containing protein